jgi:hypothetical protein
MSKNNKSKYKNKNKKSLPAINQGLLEGAPKDPNDFSDIDDNCHFEPFEQEEFVDHANSNLNTEDYSHLLDNSKYSKDFHKARPIQNYDFYNAFRNTRLLDGEFASTMEFWRSPYYDFSSYKRIKYPQKERKRHSVEVEIEKLEKLNRSVTKDIVLCAIAGGIGVFIIIAMIMDAVMKVTRISEKTAWSTIGIIFLLIAEGVAIYFLIKYLTKKFRKKKFAELKETHPYYKLSNDLVFMEANKVQFQFPTKKIDEEYKRYKNEIDKEWAISSHNFFTNRFFRFKSYNCYFSKYGRYKFYVEVKYQDCFPDYPELVNIEKQLENLPFIPKDDENPKPSIANYKSMVKKKVAELISERIPKMVVEDVIVSAGCTGHSNPKKQPKFKEEADMPFYMETPFDKEDRVIIENENYKKIEKYLK